MRLIRVAMAVVFLLAGVIIAALNPEPAHLDIWVTDFELPLGVLILAVLVLGVLLGGAVLAVSSFLSSGKGKPASGAPAPTK